jgi:hypothetical protein
VWTAVASTQNAIPIIGLAFGQALSHSPLHPASNQQVTFTAEINDPQGLGRIEILVNGLVVATCAASPCVVSGGPFPDRTAAYGANAFDTGGGRAWTGYRVFAVGDQPIRLVPVWVHENPPEKSGVVLSRRTPRGAGPWDHPWDVVTPDRMGR